MLWAASRDSSRRECHRREHRSGDGDDAALARREPHAAQEIARRRARSRAPAIERGVVVVTTGSGKGKSSSGFGMVAHARLRLSRSASCSSSRAASRAGEEAFFRRIPTAWTTSISWSKASPWETQGIATATSRRRRRHGRSRAQCSEIPRSTVATLKRIEYRAQISLYRRQRQLVAALAARPPLQHAVVILGRATPPELIEAARTVTRRTSSSAHSRPASGRRRRHSWSSPARAHLP